MIRLFIFILLFFNVVFSEEWRRIYDQLNTMPVEFTDEHIIDQLKLIEEIFRG